jgi:hypothetical protein
MGTLSRLVGLIYFPVVIVACGDSRWAMYDEFLVTDGVARRLGGGCQPLGDDGGSAIAGAGAADGSFSYSFEVTDQDNGLRIKLSGNGKSSGVTLSEKQLESLEHHSVELELNDSTTIRLVVWGGTSCERNTPDAGTTDAGS